MSATTNLSMDGFRFSKFLNPKSPLLYDTAIMLSFKSSCIGSVDDGVNCSFSTTFSYQKNKPIISHCLAESVA
ncbi:BTE_HP_G0221920.mRNA.1.CDS.1 [Saccharomyces cerevisiae]|nr:BTE_HP_G0221920.mRNA.1.CDS.1 [Saccharomyces cerevisiae]CAI6435627.1 BTE_HP_G0221920.mRNA.1.CDS.1 [Saccharomyces cerevisiae]